MRKIVTIAPRSFCAGVARSIKVVEDCLAIFGAPVYVKHAIVHNVSVVADLAAKGAVTVETVAEIPDGAVAVFSAHGSPPEHFDEARARGIRIIDATCPLVTKVHIEAARYAREGRGIVYVGHRGHIEGVGVMATATREGGAVQFVDSVADVNALTFPSSMPLALLTQTTLNIGETVAIVAAVVARYPDIVQPPARDICYATTNRQNAILAVAKRCDVILVVGSQSSSNSNRLVDVARTAGTKAYLVDSVADIDPAWVADAETVGITAGASAPEYRVQEIVAHLTAQSFVHEEFVAVAENMHFIEPLELSAARREHGIVDVFQDV